MSNKEVVNEYFSETHGFGEHKNFAINLLQNLITILDKHKIEYMLISGTLLGYCRHKDFIPWDDDIDVLVSPDFVKKLHRITSELKFHSENKITIQCPNYIYKFSHKNKISSYKKKTYCWPFIDLFVYNCCDKYINFFNKNWDLNEFFPCSKVLFNKINVNIPKNPDYFLALNYGPNYMEIYVSSSWYHKEEGPKKSQKISDNDYNYYFTTNQPDK